MRQHADAEVPRGALPGPFDSDATSRGRRFTKIEDPTQGLGAIRTVLDRDRKTIPVPNV